MSFEAALAEARAHPRDARMLEELARQAIECAEEEAALPLIEDAARVKPTARLWQWKALLERALERHDEAIRSFEAASALAPDEAGIVHGLAQTMLEAGLPAEVLYEQALRLAPHDGRVLAGLMAARLANGHGGQAEHELAAIVARTPTWIDGQMQLAQLRSMLGMTNSIAEGIERALTNLSEHAGLWRALFDIHIKGEDFGELDAAIAAARSHEIAEDILVPYEAVAAAELGRTGEADRHFAKWTDGSESIWRVRHLLRSNRARDAISLIDVELAGERASQIWPYASLAWRLTNDARFEWLEGKENFVQILDLRDTLPPLDRLAQSLRAIHVAKGSYIDQSVRGGTQTDGPLFSRLDPEIRALRRAVIAAVGKYVERLPASEPGHPLLGHRRDRAIRFAGSWSVRLRDAGHHVSHFHPQGWISSALYVALPEDSASNSPNAGWLTVGAPPAGLVSSEIEPHYVEPRPGRLVLFPSWMWHGTLPFERGERLTVAFDVAPPR